MVVVMKGSDGTMGQNGPQVWCPQPLSTDIYYPEQLERLYNAEVFPARQPEQTQITQCANLSSMEIKDEEHCD